MLRSKLSQFFLWSRVPLASFPGFWGTFNVILHIPQLFSFLARSKYLFIFSLSFISFYGLMKQQKLQDDKFFWGGCYLKLGVAEIWYSVCIWKSQRILCVSLSRIDSGLYIYHLVASSDFILLYNSQLIIFPNQSCLVLLFFGASLLLTFIIWLTISSLSPHNLHLLFFYILSIFTLI